MNEKELEFKISTGLKNIIGRELITNDLIAIFELVKNSYDAKPTKVSIVFENIKIPDKREKAKIIIIDDGDGMSYEDIINKFLFVGYSDKRENDIKKDQKEADYRDKIQKRRFFAGAKGIGRFSCDRLGNKLNLYTKKGNEKNIHHLEIDWGKFEEDQEQEFHTIKVQYSEKKNLPMELGIKNYKKGTILEILFLNDEWPWTKLKNLKFYLQRLINPAQIEKKHEFKIILEALEFEEEDKKYKKKGEYWNIINGTIENILFEKLGIKTTEINTSINGDGDKIITELIDKGEFIFRIKEKNNYKFLKDINLKVFYLNPEAKRTFTTTMGIRPVNYGSIFLYKNGIRIHPYGDEGDDWLQLEKRKTQRYAARLSTRELMGRIEIDGYQPGFIEVSSRDGGIVKNEHYNQMLMFIRRNLGILEKYVVEGIDWESETSTKTLEEIKEDSIMLISRFVGQVKDPEKEIEFNKNLLDIYKKKEVEKIPKLIKNVESFKKYVKKPEEKKFIDSQLKAMRRAARTLKKEKMEAERELEVVKKTSLFLSKAISTDKEIIINLNHTIENSTLEIKESIDDINKKIKNDSPISDVAPFLDEISIENEKIKILAGIVSLANFNTKVEWITKDLILYITDYLKTIKSGTLKFKFINENFEFKTRFRPLEISIMFDNFISNSKKARATKMTIHFKIKNRRLHVLIGDNGKGIDEKHEKFIFERGHTTTKGSGIGLSHIKSIVKSMNGQVDFKGNNYKGLEKGACFEVVIP